jgi:dihydroorotate dehydrogenase (NAD+) catalytic subunit
MLNPQISYEQNMKCGPNKNWQQENCFPKLEFLEEPRFTFLGKKIHIPLGIPAGPLLDSNFMNASINAGFQIVTYKTVRSLPWESHPWPNVLKVSNSQEIVPGGEIKCEPIQALSALNLSATSVTNSFGVPSQHPSIWHNDFQKTKFANAFPVLSFQGSRNKQQNSFTDYLKDFILTANLAARALNTKMEADKIEYGALEVNLSCPNETGVPLFLNLTECAEVIKNIKSEIKKVSANIKLIAKVGVYNENEAHNFLMHCEKYIDAISAINTVSGEIKSQNGEVILGSKLKQGGICGAGIFNHGIKTIQIFSHLLKKQNYKIQLIGVGGVKNASSVNDYLNAGAQVAQSATMAMWNLKLASEVAHFFNVPHRITYDSV